MLHRLVKLLTSYTESVRNRKKFELDKDMFHAEIKITTKLPDGTIVVVINSIAVENGLPVTYSETLTNAAGSVLKFDAGAAGNRRKVVDDRKLFGDDLVAQWKELKGNVHDLVDQEIVDGHVIDLTLYPTIVNDKIVEASITPDSFVSGQWKVRELNVPFTEEETQAVAAAELPDVPVYETVAEYLDPVEFMKKKTKSGEEARFEAEQIEPVKKKKLVKSVGEEHADLVEEAVQAVEKVKKIRAVRKIKGE